MDVLMRRSEDDRPERRAGPVVRSFRATPQSGRVIRAFVREVLSAADVPDPVASDVELVVSELGANAVEHGVGDEFTVTIDVSRRRWLAVSVTCVSDAAPALRAWRTWAIAPPDARSGRGLGIVRRLMDDVDVEARNGRLTVRCRRRLLPGE
jgi:anti-sigma regulatory factor (Ser/Thr protein kinase)